MALIEVVKYSGPSGMLVWKYPNEELGTWTQLIVNESQEAVLYKGGRATDTFGPGRHTLSTANIPILNHVVNIPFGGDSPFTAEVWYINKATVLDVKWGTSSPIQLRDPQYNIIVPVRAFGQFGVEVVDPRSLLTKIVGTLPQFDQLSLVKYFRGILMMNINELISGYLIHKKIGVLEINAYITEIAAEIESKAGVVFEEYGIRLKHFSCDSISVPEDDSSVTRLREALAKKAEMDIVGYTYQQERTFDTLEGAATNEGSTQAGVMGAGLGLGMGVGIGGAFGGQTSELGRLLNTGSTPSNVAPALKQCPDCHTGNPASAKFCSGCGKALGVPRPAEKPMHPCSACGHPLPPGAKFCPNCGDQYKACESCGADNAEEASVCGNCGRELPKPCVHCGEAVDPSAKFCPSCGKSQGVTACAGCGHELEAGQKFCPECGRGTGQ